MKCMYCDGDMERSSVPFTVHRKGIHVIWDAVPAWVCVRCGEALLAERDIDLIQSGVRALEERSLEMAARSGEDTAASG